jgi:hypothetical protein
MKLRELFENPTQATTTVGVCFGRFNPPHKGHRAAWETAAQFNHFYVGTNQNTQGADDPLPYDAKLLAMEAIWPEVAGHVIPETNLFTLVSKVYKQYGEAVDLKVCTDEDWLVNALQKYNGKEGNHGYYKFASIEQIPTPRLSSATKLRAAVRAGDREEFSEAAGVPADTPIKYNGRNIRFFDLVAHFLKQFPEKVKKKKEVSVGEEAAGVGIITKQNTTADVNASTPKKNLKAFKLAEQIKELEDQLLQAKNQHISENTSGAGFKTKGKMKPMDKTHKAAMKNATTMPGLNQAHGSAYTGWRFGLALAGAPTYPTEMEADSWLGGDPLLEPYSDVEFEMVKAAAKQVGAGTIQNWSGKRSQEVADVNKTSTVAKIKKNKYGV